MSEPATDIVIEHWARVMRNAWLTWLKPAAPDGRAQWGLGGGTFQVNRILIQPHTPGQLKHYIGMPAGWIGEVAVRVQATKIDEAQEIMDLAAAAILAKADLVDEEYAPGWSIQVSSLRPIAGLTGPKHVTVGAIYRVRLFPKVDP